jgi:hypothetical protein
MGKKIYKMTENQVATILGKKKDVNVADKPAPGLQLSGEGEKKKTKYKITEDQLKRIFNELGNKAIDEMDNYNYPMGSDTPSAPWNQDYEEGMKIGETVSGNYVGAAYGRGEFLLKDKTNNQILYTNTDMWDNYQDDEDIYSELSDYLNIPQEEEADEDGRYSVNADGWRDTISDDDLLDALASYLNDMAKMNREISVTNDPNKWEDGEHKFLLVTQQAIEQILDDKLKADAVKLLGLS